jgi:uncharacterized protein DUF5666
MARTYATQARTSIATMLLGVLLVGASLVALAACSTRAGQPSGGLRGSVASINVVTSTFVLTPQHPAAGTASLTVSISPQTQFHGALHGITDLAVGMLVTIQGTTHTSTGAIVASAVEEQHEAEGQVQQNQRETDELKGTIDAVASGQSAFVLKLADGTLKTIIVSNQTEFEGSLHGIGDLAKGQQVEVKGSTQTDGTIVAASVEAENEAENEPQQNEPEQGDGSAVELMGTISLLDGAHASFTLKLADGTTRLIVTTGQTEFDGGFSGFADLKIGMWVEVRGAIQHDGSLLAARVHREDDGGSTSGSSGSSGSSGGSGSGDGSGTDGHSGSGDGGGDGH